MRVAALLALATGPLLIACASREPEAARATLPEEPPTKAVATLSVPAPPPAPAPSAEPSAPAPVESAIASAAPEVAPPKAEASPVAQPVDLVIQDLRPGRGRAVVKGDRVVVHYVGQLRDGTVFDTTQTRGQPASFDIGKGHLIAGWERGMLGMKAGGKRRLVVPPHLGYGAKGAGNKIPPDATLIFEIELISVQ